MTARASDTGSPTAIGVAGRGSRRSRTAIVLGLAAAVAMAATAMFIARVLMIRHLAGDFTNVSQDYLWMTPASYLLLFGVAALPVLIIARVLDPQRAAWLATFVFGTLAIFDALLPITSIGRLPAVLFAAGLAATIARSVAPRIAAAPRVAWAIAAVALMSFIGAGVLFRERRPTVLAGSPAMSATLPNVLLIILDTVRADEVGAYGSTRGATPHLDTFAARSMVFESAMATAPWTLPSHASVFTGRYAANLNTDYKVPLDERDSTLAEVLHTRGYATVGFTGNLWYTSWESGLTRGFQSYRAYQRSFEQLVKSTHFGRTDLVDALFRAGSWRDAARAIRPAGLREVPRPQPAPNTAEYLTDEFLSWHTRRDTLRPFFAFLNYFDAHDPFLPVEPYRSRFATADSSEYAPARALYDAELAYLDEHLGRLLETLEQRGGLTNTLVIVTADHGEHFGERNFRGHFASIYMPLLWVPLVMRFDGRLPVRRVDGEVSLRDIPATIMDVIGADLRSPLPGRSLAGQWTGEGPAPSAAVSTYSVTRNDPLDRNDNGMFSLVENGWHYILSGRKEMEELYRYRADPGERRNLVGSDSGEAIIPGLRARLTAALAEERRSATRTSTQR